MTAQTSEKPSNKSKRIITVEAFEKSLSRSKRSVGNQRRRMFSLVKWYKVPLVCLAACSTIILGMDLELFADKEKFVYWQKNTALALTAIITLLTTLMTFFKIEEYWLHNKVIEQQLRLLEDRLNYAKAKGIGDKGLDDLFDEYQTIMWQQHDYWKGALGDLNEEGAG